MKRVCGCAVVGTNLAVGGALLWGSARFAEEQRASLADLRRMASQAGVGLPRNLRVTERFDEQRDHLWVKGWNLTSVEPIVVEGLSARAPSDGEHGIDQKMLQKQFPRRRLLNALERRWEYGGTAYWAVTAKDQGTWYTLFQSTEVVP